MSMLKPNSSLLSQAHAAAQLRGALAETMRSPVRARCLKITALSRPLADRYRPPPTAPPAPSDLPPNRIN